VVAEGRGMCGRRFYYHRQREYIYHARGGECTHRQEDCGREPVSQTLELAGAGGGVSERGVTTCRDGSKIEFRGLSKLGRQKEMAYEVVAMC